MTATQANLSPAVSRGLTPTTDLPPCAVAGTSTAARPCPRVRRGHHSTDPRHSAVGGAAVSLPPRIGGSRVFSTVATDAATDVIISGERFAFIPVRPAGLSLLPAQAEALDFINRERDAGRGFPSYRRIARALGHSSTRTPFDHVRKLIERGHIEASETNGGAKHGNHGRGF